MKSFLFLLFLYLILGLLIHFFIDFEIKLHNLINFIYFLDEKT